MLSITHTWDDDDDNRKHLTANKNCVLSIMFV